MGKTGSDISVESANIVLMGNDVSKIVYLKKTCQCHCENYKIQYYNFTSNQLSSCNLISSWSV